MKTFEECFTAWVDGQLTGDDLAAFEKELANHPEAMGDREAALKIGDLLRTHPTVPALANAAIFNLQLQQRIEAETPRPRGRNREEREPFFWTLPRLLWAGVACLAIAGVLFGTMIPKTSEPAPSNYFAQVVEAWPSDPSISATTVYDPKDNVTVLWLEGLDYIPRDQIALK